MAKLKSQCTQEEWREILANSSYKRASAIKYREQWLNRLIGQLRPIFLTRGYELPGNIRVTFSWPARARKAVGQCFHHTACDDGHFELFISPKQDQFNARTLAATLVHELIHTLDGCNSKTAKRAHGKTFEKVMRALDLGGKPTATIGTNAMWVWLDPLLAATGPFPGAAVNLASVQGKKQTTRMIKCECPECGTIFRMSRSAALKAAKSMGTLRCPDWDCVTEVHWEMEADDGE